MNHLKRDHPSTWLSMLIDFETKKRGDDPKNSKGISLNISLYFAKQFEKYSGEDLEDRIRKRKGLNVKFSNGMLRISGEALRKMYENVIPNMITHIRQLLDEHNGHKAKKMFLVGGFAESAYLQECITSEFGRDVNIFIPEEAGMCVMKGAVLFGHDTDYITSRIARLNYEIPLYYPFDEAKHDIRRKETVHGKERIYLLKMFVRKGQRIKVSEIVSENCTLRVGQEKANFPLYSTECDTDNPKDASANLLETITISNSNVEKEDREVTISLRFGGTDISDSRHFHKYYTIIPYLGSLKRATFN